MPSSVISIVDPHVICTTRTRERAALALFFCLLYLRAFWDFVENFLSSKPIDIVYGCTALRKCHC